MHRRYNLSCLLPGIIMACVASCSPPSTPASRPAGILSADSQFRRMIENEKLIETLTPKLSQLARAITNFQLPDSHTSPLFLPDAVAVDLKADRHEEPGAAGGRLPVREWRWAVGEDPIRLTEKPNGLWRDLWSGVDYFEMAKFGVIRGVAAGAGKFGMELAFSARARGVKGKVIAFQGSVNLDWEKEDDWKIRRWTTLGMSAMEAASPLFEEVLRTAIPQEEAYREARRSVHHDYTRDILLTGETTFRYRKEFWPYLTTFDSLDQHPSVAVVDIDRDGWDDFYVTARWGRNQLWRNNGDGTFENIAERLGLDIDGLCNCALFADFDNDGDADVFLGRSLERGLFLMNDGGHFVDVSDLHLDAPLPYWTSSMAAADYNGDGLLDLYISTYRLPISRPQNILATDFLSPSEQTEWKRRRAQDHPVFRLTGPPNVLLINRGGGRFERAPEGKDVELWLSTFQSTWADYDNDGDPDLFVANDYGPDFVFRNDAAEGGARKFTDVTKVMAGDELQGFGMGVSLGDYDNDGLQDPFYTYMFSKAGSRITEMFQGLEKRMYEGARGNKLLKNRGDHFEVVSGLKPPGLLVAKTGWSWGGQFADLDNDSFLDLYVSNGYYTPPEEAATEVDL